VNSSKNSYNINFTKHPVVYTLKYVSGTYLSSVSGKTYFEKDYNVKQLTPMKLQNKIYKGSEFKIDPFSVGYIEFNPSE
jgi:hypothetical protein